MTKLKIICTHYHEGIVTSAEVRPDGPDAPQSNRDFTEPAEFASTSHQPISDCKRFIARQPDSELSKIVYL